MGGAVVVVLVVVFGFVVVVVVVVFGFVVVVVAVVVSLLVVPPLFELAHPASTIIKPSAIATARLVCDPVIPSTPSVVVRGTVATHGRPC